MKEQFEPDTSQKANGQTRVLLLDGHSSHMSLELLEFAIAHNIVILIYPPHCTHALQGLDVVCFAKMKHIWHKTISNFEQTKHRSMAKDDFTELFGTAFLQAFDTQTVLAAFAKTGVWPFNRSAITMQQMKPSERTSTQTAYPATMPSPVRRVVTSYGKRLKTINNGQLDNSPKRTLDKDTDSDTAPDTPTKRANILHASLSMSSSGSFLLSTTRFNGTEEIASPVIEKPPALPEPQWGLLCTKTSDLDEVDSTDLRRQVASLSKSLSLAQMHIDQLRGINERANAQLVVQELFAREIKTSLYEKKNKPTRDNSQAINNSCGEVFTSTQVLTIIAEQEKKKAEAQLKKQAKRKERKDRQEANTAREQAWKVEKAIHQRKVEEWKENDDKLKTSGIPLKDRPPRPPRMIRKDQFIAEWDAKHVAGLDGVDGGQSDGELDDDDGDDDDESNVNSDGDTEMELM